MYERPSWVRRIAGMGPSLGDARALVGLDADELIATATRLTRLDDFGPPEWEESFRRLVAALDGEAQLHVVGRLVTRHDLLRHLSTRLRVLDAHRRTPAMAAEQIVAPIVVTGPARSGTSILQELLAQDPQLRCPLAFEMAHPTSEIDDPGPRAWAQAEFDLWGDVQPEFLAVHELDASLPEECLWLTAPEFDLGFWATCTDVPSWFGWRAVTDPAPIYRMHRTMLQALQHRDAARRGAASPRTWALKSPMHLGRLPALLAAYPDARIIHTHRDPVKTIPSSASTVYAGRWLRSDAIDPIATGASVGTGLQFTLNGVAAARAAGHLPEAQFADLHYLDLLRDPVAALRRTYERLDLRFDDETAARALAYLAARPQHKHGTHRYRAEDFGLDLDDIRERYAPYTDQYGVEHEPA
jgi:hypothetical protein